MVAEEGVAMPTLKTWPVGTAPVPDIWARDTGAFALGGCVRPGMAVSGCGYIGEAHPGNIANVNISN
jgi:hypothetical protein